MSRTIILTGALLAATLLHPVGVLAQEAPSEPLTVIASLTAALDTHDAVRASSLLAQDANVLASTSIFGRASITQWLAGQFPSDAVVEVTPHTLSGSRVIWHTRVTRGIGLASRVTRDEAVVVNGLVRFWSSRPQSGPLEDVEFQRARRLDPATRGSQADAVDAAPSRATIGLLAIGVGMLVALAAGFAMGIAAPPREARQRHGGQMLAALRQRLKH